MKKKLLVVFLLFIIFAQILFIIFQRREEFFSRNYQKRFSSLESLYKSSQYVKKNNPTIITDETFESYVGGAFIRGVNPIHIVHEHPPLGRYIIGLSILLFDNASLLTIPLMSLSFLGIYLISRLVIKSTWLSLIPLAIYANEQLVLTKFQYAPQLEPTQLTFIVWGLYFFIRGLMAKRFFGWFMASAIMVGCVMSIRFFVLGASMIVSMMSVLLIDKFFQKAKSVSVQIANATVKNNKLIGFIFALPLSLLVILLSYTKTIQEGYSLLQILGIQKYIFVYHRAKLFQPFSFWDLILFNRWHTWWGDRRITTDPTWNIIWPIAITLVVLYILFVLARRFSLNLAEKVLFSWVGCYIILLSIGDSTTRYFLPLLPFLYILSVNFIWKIIAIHKKQ